MAKLSAKPIIELKINFALNEAEVRALDALVGYGSKGFLEVFYKHMGRAYLQPHEAGLVSLFESVREQLPSILERTRKARDIFEGRSQSVPSNPPQPVGGES